MQSAPKNFALIGAAGFIAPKHMAAIKATDNQLVAALDKSDSVGVIDSHFPSAAFFTEFERFDRHIHKLSRQEPEKRVNFVSICSPNYLHDAHIRFALRSQADAICEKPLVLNPWNIDGLIDLEKETGHSVYTILQLRLHPAILRLKEQVAAGTGQTKHDVDLCYITPRGNWYLNSWKGETSKSGGIATNIGVHFFDMLGWIFGGVRTSVVHISTPTKTAGLLDMEHARIRWFLSVDVNDLPEQNKTTRAAHRALTINGEEIEFSDGFKDLHNSSYESILRGNGFKMEDARQAIEMLFNIRNGNPVGLHGDYHPHLRR